MATKIGNTGVTFPDGSVQGASANGIAADQVHS